MPELTDERVVELVRQTLSNENMSAPVNMGGWDLDNVGQATVDAAYIDRFLEVGGITHYTKAGSTLMVITNDGTDEGVNAAIDTGALNILLTAGGTVDATITIDNANTLLSGGGWGTVLDASGWAQGASHAINLNGMDYCTVENLALSGNLAGGASGALLYGAGCVGTKISKIYAENADDEALWFATMTYSSVSNCYIKDAAGKGIYGQSGNSNTYFGNLIENSGDYGIHFAQTGSTAIANVLVNVAHGIQSGSVCAAVVGNSIYQDTTATGIYGISEAQTITANALLNVGHAVYLAADAICCTGNITRLSRNPGLTLANGADGCSAVGNIFEYVYNTFNDINIIGANTYFACVGNVGFSLTTYSERFLDANNLDYGLIVGNVSKGHDVGSIDFDASCSHNICGWNRLEHAIVNAGSNNIILEHDTTNMISTANYAQSWIAADGARPELYVGIFHNLEATPGDSNGVYIRAGSDAVDFNIRGYDFNAANELWHVDGAGGSYFKDNMGIGVAASAARLNLLSTSYAIVATSNFASNYAAFFINDGNNVNRYGIKVQCGEDVEAGTNYWFGALDGDGGVTGYLQSVAGVFALADVSDSSLKNVIGKSQINGLERVRALSVDDFEFKKNVGHILHGFVANKVAEVVPEAASFADDTGLWAYSRDMLVPTLWKAAQEADTERTAMQAEINELRAKVTKLRKKVA